jgi:hypothetical protein
MVDEKPWQVNDIIDVEGAIEAPVWVENDQKVVNLRGSLLSRWALDKARLARSKKITLEAGNVISNIGEIL